MLTSIEIYDLLIRGATGGLLTVASCIFLRSDKQLGTRSLLGIFLLLAAAYPIISSPTIWHILGPEKYYIRFAANLAIIPLWFSICHLFDDQFKFRVWRFIPLAFLLGVIIIRAIDEPQWGAYANVFQHSITLIIMGHALWLILSQIDDDLVQSRRDSRLAFAFALIALTLFIALGELTNILSHTMPSWVSVVHGFVLLSITGYFFFKFTNTKNLFEDKFDKAASNIDAQDQQLFLKRLERMMAEGVYKEEGLKVGELARRLNMSEHKLRNLINYGLGFKNFPSYLNEIRVKKAKQDLSNPDKSHLQILQIALDVGYGSIGPFNRAFKADTGVTPTVYRKKALSNIS